MSDTSSDGDGRAGRGSELGVEYATCGAGDVSPAPAEIAELAQGCRQYVQRAVGVELDLTPETLPVLDHYVGLVRQNLDERPQLLPLLARTVGAYFGEVVRRRLGFFWHLPSGDAHTWQLCGRSVFVSISPIGVAYDALRTASEHEGPSSHLRIAPEERGPVDQRLASLPPVPEDEYFMLATRLEVIEIATDALRVEMLQGGTADVQFDASDYESAGLLE